jgi:hypothetical protein
LKGKTMGTRAIIHVKGEKVGLYRHSDGYPDREHGVLKTLRPFVEDFVKNRGNDPCFFLARLAQMETNKLDSDWLEDGCFNERYKFLGFGIVPVDEWECAYRYIVDLETANIEVV